jgi:hypothetical protein
MLIGGIGDIATKWAFRFVSVEVAGSNAARYNTRLCGYILPSAVGVGKMEKIEESKWYEYLSDREFITFPKELDKKCTLEEFHKIMTTFNSDIPIDQVNFRMHPN